MCGGNMWKGSFRLFLIKGFEFEQSLKKKKKKKLHELLTHAVSVTCTT